MKSAFVRLFWVLTALLGAPAYADSFTFSYTFASDGTSVSGTFEGIQNGLFVDNISNVSVAAGGTVIPAAFYTASMDSSSNWVSTPVVSFDLAENNFVFADSDFASGDLIYSNVFYIIQGSVAFGTYFESSPEIPSFDDPGTPGTWKLTNLSTSVAVPDGGMTAGMLFLALAGFALLRRQTAA